jgi:hypothetical protein
MSNQIGSTFDPTSDVCEIGLMAAASPDFLDALVRALLEASRDAGAASDPGDPTKTQVAA